MSTNQTVEITQKFNLVPVEPAVSFDTGRHGNSDEELVLACQMVKGYVTAKWLPSGYDGDLSALGEGFVKLRDLVNEAEHYLHQAKGLEEAGDLDNAASAYGKIQDVYDDVESWCSDHEICIEFDGEVNTWFLWDDIRPPGSFDDASDFAIVKQHGDTWSVYGGGFDKPIEGFYSFEALILETKARMDHEVWWPYVLVTFDDELTFFHLEEPYCNHDSVAVRNGVCECGARV